MDDAVTDSVATSDVVTSDVVADDAVKDHAAKDYVVLARKLRPARFQDLIGQETVARSLRNAVVSGRTAHAYLFAGSRGVGKTSAARILTKALNCLDLKEGEPCNACTNCEEITNNAAPDVLEIDAASNRGIDNIRELRENTKYAPAKCTYKTYIIDEVHMLTMESFNALLKTLEEPPPHVKFILATTAPHRIPETIVSRCQRYDFPRIPVGLMQEYLARVTKDEGIALSPTALEIIARGAAGGMRDALTAVDQVVAFAGVSPADEQVLSILEVMDTREVLNLLGALLDKNLEQALAMFSAIVVRGHDLTILLEALLREVKDFSLYQSLTGKSAYFQDHPPTTLEFFGSRKEAVTLDELQQIFYLLLELEGQLKLSEHSWACFEMALVKACRVEPLVGVPELLAQVRGLMDAPASGRQPPVGSTEPPAGSTPPQGEHRQEENRPAAQPKPRAREGGAKGQPGGQAASAQDGEAEGGSAPSVASSPSLPQQHQEESTRPAPPSSGPPAGAYPPPPAQQPPQEGAPPPAALSGAGLSTTPAAGEAGQSTQPPSQLPAGSTQPPAGSTQPPAGGAQPPAGGAQPPAHAPPLETPSLEENLPCEDARWLALVEAVKDSRRKLAADLRRVEVTAIAGEEVRIVLPDSGVEIREAELEFLHQPLAEAFGAAFQLRIDHDSNRKARHGYSLIGREEQIEQARLDVQYDAAVNDEKVQRVMRAFPQGQVEEVTHPEAPRNRRNDV